MKRQVKVTVSGNVQGVGFRELIKKKAENCLVEGMVQNHDDGTVVIHAAGTSDSLDELIDFLYQGNKKIRVDAVLVEVALTPRDYRGVFRIIGSD